MIDKWKVLLALHSTRLTHLDLHFHQIQIANITARTIGHLAVNHFHLFSHEVEFMQQIAASLLGLLERILNFDNFVVCMSYFVHVRKLLVETVRFIPFPFDQYAGCGSVWLDVEHKCGECCRIRWCLAGWFFVWWCCCCLWRWWWWKIVFFWIVV